MKSGPLLQQRLPGLRLVMIGMDADCQLFLEAIRQRVVTGPGTGQRQESRSACSADILEESDATLP